MTTDKQTLKLDQIRIDGGTQPRVAIDEQVVAEYAEKYSNGTDLKPVIVFYDGATYWLADGFHRYWANKRIDCEYIFADVYNGTQRDAILYSVGANADHGLRRSNEDKRKAVATMLTDPTVCQDDEGKPWTDSAIAKQCKVSPPTVAKVRSTLNIQSAPVRKTSDGRTMDTTNIGRPPNRKFKPAGGIAKDAFRTPSPQSLQSRVPMKNVDLPLNNPRKAAHCMVSVYGEDYMRTLCDELNNLFKKGHPHD